MLRPGKIGAAWMLGLIVLLAAGVWHLLSLRYEQGDVYPPYSTLRSDPLGSRALHDSFVQLAGVETRRHFETLEKVGSGEGTALVLLGADWRSFDETEEEEARWLEGFMREGGRLVVVFRGQLGAPIMRYASSSGGSTNSPRRLRLRQPRGQPATPVTNIVSHLVLEQRWGVGLDYRPLGTNDFGEIAVGTARREDGPILLPEELAWRSSMVFHVWTNALPDAAWRHVYVRDDLPVVLERRFGRGSVVLMSDAYFTSNEALWDDRQTALLHWMVGGAGRVVFNETHLGVMEQPGVATLMRRYHLFWIVGAALAVFGLAIWRNASPLLPMTDDDPIGLAREGRDARGALVSLLRRSIPPAELLGYCFREWQKSGAARRQVSADRQRRAKELAAGAEPEPGRKLRPVDSYREIARTLHHKR